MGMYEDIKRQRESLQLQQLGNDLPDDYVLGSNQEKPQQASQAAPEASIKGNSTGILSDIGKGLVKGGAQAGRNIFNAIDDAGNWLNDNVANLRTTSQQKAHDELKAKNTKVGTEMFQPTVDAWTTGSTANQMTADISEFLVGFIPLFRAERAFTAGMGVKAATTKTGKLASAAAVGAVAGAGASATTVTPETANLSQMINTHFPSLSSPITNYLQVSPEDTQGEKRLKQALDSVLAGAVTGPVLEGMFMALKGYKASKLASGATDGGAKELQEAVEVSKENLNKPNLAEQIDSSMGIGKEPMSVEELAGRKNAFESTKTPVEVKPNEAQVNLESVSKDVDDLIKNIEDTKVLGSESSVEVQIPKDSELSKLIPEGVTVTQPELTGFQEAMKSQAGFVDPTMLAKIWFGGSKGEIGSSLVGGVAGWNSEDADAPLKDKLMMAAMGSLGGRALYRMKSPAEIKQFRKENPVTSVLATREGLEGIAPKGFRPPPKFANVNKERLSIFAEKVKAGHFEKVTTEDTAELQGLIRNIDSEEDIEQLLTMTMEAFDKDIKAAKVGSIGDKATGTRSWSEANQLAGGLEGIKNVNDIFSVTKNLDSRMRAAQATVVASANEVLTAGKILRDLENGVGQGFVSVEERTAALDAASLALDKAVKAHATIQAKVIGSASEIGRGLGILRQIHKTEAEMAGQLGALVESIGGRKQQLKLAEALKGITDPRQVNAAMQKSFLGRVLDGALYMRLTGILWSPITQVRNILGNTLKVISTPMEGMLEAGVASVRGAEEGVVRKSVGEVKTEAFGLFQGLQDAVSYLWHEKKFGDGFYKKIAGDESFLVHDGATKAGETQLFSNNALGDIIQNPTSQTMQSLQTGLDNIGSVMGANLHFMGATDKFFQALNYRMSLNAQAYRSALTEGLAPGTPEFLEHIAKTIEAPSMEITESAMKAAREGTFQQKLDQGDYLDAVGSSVNSLRNQIPALSIIFPFVKTPTNILRYVGSRTPLLGASPLARQHSAVMATLKEGGPEADKILGQWAFGSMLLAGSTTLAYQGFLVGGNDGLRDKGVSLTNSQNFAIKIGDKTYKIDGLDPIGMFLGIGAELGNTLKRDDYDGATELVATSMVALTKYTLDKSYMQGLFDVVGMLNDLTKKDSEGGIKAFEGYVAQQGTSFMPFGGLSNWAAKQVDPTVKSYWDWKDRWAAKIPFVSQNVYAKRNILTGEPITSEGALGPDMLSPLTTKTLDNSPSVQELVRLGVNIDYPNKSIDRNIPLSAAEYDRLQVIATQEVKIQGKNLKEMLDSMVTSPRWESYPDGQDGFSSLSNTKEARLKHMINTYRDKAEKQLLRENEEVKGLFNINKENKVKARRGEIITPLPDKR